MESSLFVFLLFTVIGMLFTLVGIYFLTRSNKIAKEGTRTRAKIVDYEVEVSNNSDGYETTYYYPILEFTDRGGNKVKHSPDTGSTSKISTKSIDIFYIYEDGEYHVVVNTKMHRHLMPWGFIGIGLFFITISLLVYLGVNPLEGIGYLKFYK